MPLLVIRLPVAKYRTSVSTADDPAFLFFKISYKTHSSLLKWATHAQNPELAIQSMGDCVQHAIK